MALVVARRWVRDVVVPQRKGENPPHWHPLSCRDLKKPYFIGLLNVRVWIRPRRRNAGRARSTASAMYKEKLHGQISHQIPDHC